MFGFGNFARIASLCVDFDLSTLHGYFFHLDFGPNLNFPLEHQIKLVLNLLDPGTLTRFHHFCVFFSNNNLINKSDTHLKLSQD